MTSIGKEKRSSQCLSYTEQKGRASKKEKERKKKEKKAGVCVCVCGGGGGGTRRRFMGI